MAQDHEQTQKCSGGGGVRCCKKQKPKKVPQRGLGVAQLERIRLEEQQKKKDFIASSSSSSSSTIIISPKTKSSSSEILNSNVVVHNNFWSCCEYHLEKQQSSFGLGFHSNPIWPIPSLMQRAATQQFQQQQPSSSTMIEPPSNQSYYSNNFAHMWTDDEKMVGMKRPYPFSVDSPPGFSSSFQYKYPPIVNHPITRSSDDSAASSGSGHTLNFEPTNSVLRESSTFMLEPSSKQNMKENGGFLTLAPPAAATDNSLPQCSKFKNHRRPSYLSFPDFESLPYQGSVEDPFLLPESVSRGGGWNQGQQPYYSFFPQAMAGNGQATSAVNNCNNGGVCETVDLNLKL